MPTNTQDTEAPGDADEYAGSFPNQDIDIFGGGGTRGQEVELDEDALAQKAEADAKKAKAAKKKAKKKKRFGFG